MNTLQRRWPSSALLGETAAAIALGQVWHHTPGFLGFIDVYRLQGVCSQLGLGSRFRRSHSGSRFRFPYSWIKALDVGLGYIRHNTPGFGAYRCSEGLWYRAPCSWILGLQMFIGSQHSQLGQAWRGAAFDKPIGQITSLGNSADNTEANLQANCPQETTTPNVYRVSGSILLDCRFTL